MFETTNQLTFCFGAEPGMIMASLVVERMGARYLLWLKFLVL
jgi:hypothetical protein